MMITLTGYRGTGKSSVAPLLANRLGWSWIDADAEIERRAGQSISDIFAAGGEPEFRRQERAVMVDLLSRDRLVIASGGGAILDEQTRRDMQQAGPVVWLEAEVDTILARMGTDETTTSRRPALTEHDPRAEVEQLLSIRGPLYEAVATIRVKTDQQTPEQIVEQLLTELPADVQETGR
ncbi:Shikimate kinase [Maioricimonas rarisocia]|uniref:Shikimate kinase n=2 Tax=Maioricimonas rarisocia TaxID=2528026 RepID=A0A517Z234_9PLAN|nr:Shikimate kinase [Maioricimonas rarisocia]